MVRVERGSVDEFFAGAPLGRQVYGEVAAIVDGIGPATVRVTKSQVAFRRRTGFCWVWLPGRYLSNPGAEVVVSLALGREDASSRWKEVAQVAGHWMHHLEVHDIADLDADVVGLLAEAYASAA